jgi:WD domain, G-beta repeat
MCARPHRTLIGTQCQRQDLGSPELATQSGLTGAADSSAWAAPIDGTARIWDATTGDSTVLTGHTGPVSGVVWSPDGTRLATASADGTVRVRSLPEEWPRQLCRRAGRNLDLNEWTTLLGDDIPYQRQCAQFPSASEAPPDAPAAPLPALP